MPLALLPPGGPGFLTPPLLQDPRVGLANVSQAAASDLRPPPSRRHLGRGSADSVITTAIVVIMVGVESVIRSCAQAVCSRRVRTLLSCHSCSHYPGEGQGSRHIVFEALTATFFTTSSASRLAAHACDSAAHSPTRYWELLVPDQSA